MATSSPQSLHMNCEISKPLTDNSEHGQPITTHSMIHNPGLSSSSLYEHISDPRQVDNERLSKTSSFETTDDLDQYIPQPNVPAAASTRLSREGQVEADAYSYSCIARKSIETNKIRKDMATHVPSPIDYSMTNQGYSSCSDVPIPFSTANWSERCDSTSTSSMLQENSPSQAVQNQFNQSGRFGYTETSNCVTLPSHSPFSPVHHQTNPSCHVPVKKEQMSPAQRQFLSRPQADWPIQRIESLSPESADGRAVRDQSTQNFSTFFDTNIRRTGSDSLIEGSVSTDSFEGVFSHNAHVGNRRIISNSLRMGSSLDLPQSTQVDERQSFANASTDAMRLYNRENDNSNTANIHNSAERRYSLPVFPQSQNHRQHPYKHCDQTRPQRPQANDLGQYPNAAITRSSEYLPYASSPLSMQQQPPYPVMTQAHLQSL